MKIAVARKLVASREPAQVVKVDVVTVAGKGIKDILHQFNKVIVWKQYHRLVLPDPSDDGLFVIDNNNSSSNNNRHHLNNRQLHLHNNLREVP